MFRYALIAQPDPSVARMYASVIEGLGLSALVAADGAQALEVLAHRGAPALGIVELTLPGLDGFQVVEQMRRLGPVDRTPVLATSPFRSLRGFAGYGATRLGIDKVIARSVARPVFERTVMALLGLRVEGPEPQPEPSRTRVRAARQREARAALPDTRLQWFVDRLACEFNVEIALARLELDDGRMLTATSGLDTRDVRRMDPFAHLIVDAGEALCVSDTQGHPFFKDEPVVKAGLVRGYAGAPILDVSGETRGTLSLVTSRGPLPIGAERFLSLVERAAQVGQVISYLGGRVVPRDEDVSAEERGVQGSGEWATSLAEAPTEPENATG